jgi:putative oxidoreductase
MPSRRFRINAESVRYLQRDPCALVRPRGFWRDTIMKRFAGVTHSLLRIVAGLLFICPGGMKLFGWFGGMPGPPAAGGLSPLMVLAGLIEVFGGALILLGLFTRPVAFIAAGEMAFAYFIGHFPRGFWPIQNHGEPAVLFCFIYLFLAANGAGPWSLDHLIRRPRAAEPDDAPAMRQSP